MSPEQLTEQLTTFSQERLITEVMTMWTELGEMERSLAMSRQRARALDSELGELRARGVGRGDVAELRERFRVAEARRAQLETMLENERVRRSDLEELVGGGRLDELQRENVRSIQREEEYMLLILDMEGKIDQLVALVEELQNRDAA
jgi:ABC-type phosphate transport system auxiliary subunit